VTSLDTAVESVLVSQKKSKKPLAVILAGHNGSGKSTMWYKKGLADSFRIPLVNADRIMMSVLPETAAGSSLPKWASDLRNKNQSWMRVAQKSVEAFVARAMAEKVPFAMETVFSHWKALGNGVIESKINLIREMQSSDYFVLLLFVGLSNVQLSFARVRTRVQEGGHDVDDRRLSQRFPRTQEAIKHAVGVADAAILIDNSREQKDAFTVCRIQIGNQEIYDCRKLRGDTPSAILEWLSVVSPQ
jgi:predicted ABC-type ATPase